AIARVRHSRKEENSSTGQPAARLSRFERLKMFCRSNSDGAKIIKQKKKMIGCMNAMSWSLLIVIFQV
ncbi:MAG TPA: hypothetical protein VKM55_13630, partial [Candidatus Lokiarchaeia archaeon]|nr:hypothetical protein [Candidatus Lokiarchaeia archaeon]